MTRSPHNLSVPTVVSGADFFADHLRDEINQMYLTDEGTISPTSTLIVLSAMTALIAELVAKATTTTAEGESFLQVLQEEQMASYNAHRRRMERKESAR